MVAHKTIYGNVSLTYHEGDSLCLADGRLFVLFQLVKGVLILPEIPLGTHQHYRDIGTVVPHLNKGRECY